MPPALTELAMPDPPTGLPFNAKPRKRDLEDFLAKFPMPRLGGPLPEVGNGREEYEKVIFWQCISSFYHLLFFKVQPIMKVLRLTPVDLSFKYLINDLSFVFN